MMTRILAAACACLLAAGSAALKAVQQQEPAPVFDVPRMENVRIDGDVADWGQEGYWAGLLTPVKGRGMPGEGFDVDARLGWNDQGLLVALKVWDDAFLEAPSQADIWQGDSVEVFLAEKVGAAGWSHATISPGVDPARSHVRVVMVGHGTLEGTDLQKVEVARQKNADGYTMEVLLPWKSLGISPAAGALVGFQMWVTDVDVPQQRPIVLTWCPKDDTPKDSKQMYAVRLAGQPSPTPVVIRQNVDFDNERLRVMVRVVASEELTGKTARLAADGRTLAQGMLARGGSGRAECLLVLPDNEVFHGKAQLLVEEQDDLAQTVELPDVATRRAEAFVHATPSASPSVFYGPLPKVEFAEPLWVEQIIGPYEIKTIYYDRNYNVVTRAEKPGRYGAVAEIRTRDGRVYRRFLTLFALPKPIEPPASMFASPLHFVDELGVRPPVASAFESAIAEWLTAQVRAQSGRTSEAAVLLAGLSETKGTPAKDDFWSHPDLADRAWWLGCKRKIYGWDKRWPEPMKCPQTLEGKPAPVLREGTLEEAGMKPNAPQTIDAVLTEWSRDSDQAFAVCVARHGVIVLHKAYGQRDGKPMTVDTKSWMASITKMLSGTLMMMAVDQGRINLDDEAARYLPALLGVKTNAPLTIRHLYTHTSGLDWHWGDDASDMEERIAFLLPHLEVGKRYFYNGTGMALACKALEAVTGETLPALYKNHLLDPLGCKDTQVSGASGDAVSVPMDMAKIAQMLLNRGAYGNMRFMRESTFRQMLPVKLTKILGPDTDKVYGIGTMAYPDEGLGKDTFAHGAASSACIRIDPTNDLVIVMTRNAGGKNFEKYQPRFLKAVVESTVSR